MRSDRKDPGGIMLLGFIVCGAVYLSYFGLQRILTSMDYMERAIPAFGKVVSYTDQEFRQPSTGEWIKLRRPSVEFKLLNGDVRQVMLADAGDYELNDTLNILYLETPPHQVTLGKFEKLWEPGLYRLGFGLLLFIFAIRLPIWRKTSLIRHWRQR
ncbi:MAG: hypothetical protein HOM11_00275 [Methylococcales bacterium]|jgi:hypothetical protein|nr:hypothetical protein [Methylococcales bacterium]MBT7444681.1 hypothetical protein [Methylococcales bacterium]